MNETLMQAAIAYANEHESPWDRSAQGVFGVHQSDPPPWNRTWGPLHDRGPVSGVVVAGGKTLVSWGEPERADLTYSVAKMYLALVAGVAWDQGLIRDLDQPIGRQLPGIGFDAGNNAQITWRHMLQQTSEWEGERWGISDQADRYRAVTYGEPPQGKKGDARPLQAPGTYWEYNDVRINQLSYALMNLFRRPVPEVFREFIARPLGCSESWQWVGYGTSWVELDGKRMQSVPGGSHWGGGCSISSLDQALIGQMLLDGGKSRDGRPVLPEDWIRQMREPCALAPYYGFLIWLNHQGKIFPSLPASSFFGVGAGSSYTWVEPGRKLVVVARWLDSSYADQVFGKILAAVDG
jgi:CubicO group peptidase (beta-lactamase class C family)